MISVFHVLESLVMKVAHHISKEFMINRYRLLILASMMAFFSLSSCLRPVDGDFPIHGQGLSDDELLWVLRIPATPADADLTTVGPKDSIKFADHNVPFFQTTLQTILKRVLSGDIPSYEEYPAKTLLENPRERLLKIGGSGQNLEPLLHIVELYVVLNTKYNYYSGKPRYLRLIWTNPDGREADRGFAGLDLSGDWVNEILIEDQNLSEFATNELFFSLPVYLRTNFREYAIQSLEEARYVDKMVHAGKWRDIDWVADGINTSGKKKVKLEPETVMPLGGFFQFSKSPRNDSSSVQELYLTAENDYLIADWSNRFKIEKVLPFAPYQFFSNSGELYEFFVDENELLHLQVIQGTDTLWGIKLGEE